MSDVQHAIPLGPTSTATSPAPAPLDDSAPRAAEMSSVDVQQPSGMDPEPPKPSASTAPARHVPTNQKADYTVEEGDAPAEPPAPPRAVLGSGARGGGTSEGKGKQVDLELLLPSGARRKWSFGEGTSVGEVKQVVFREWPAEWAGEGPRPSSAADLRLVFLGRFLQDKEKLSDQRLQGSDGPTQTTIMHLMIRSVPSPEDDDLKKGKRKFSCCVVS